MEAKAEVKKTVWLWTVIGLFAGGWLGMMFAGIIGGIIAGTVAAVMAYRSSAENGGGTPAWLWRSKKK